MGNGISKFKQGKDFSEPIVYNFNEWIVLPELSPTSQSVLFEPTALNHNQFITAPFIKEYTAQLCIYDAGKNKWNQSKKYPNVVTGCYPAVMNNNNNTLYICHFTQMIKYNFKKSKWKITLFGKNNYLNPYDSEAICFSYNNAFHLIGSYQHLIWDETQNKFKVISKYNILSVSKPRLFYRKSKNRVLLIDNMQSIWEYSLIQCKWKKSSDIIGKPAVPIDFSKNRMVLTNDDEYVLCFNRFSVLIFIIDLDKHKLHKSVIKQPIIGSCSYIMTNDYESSIILIEGYIRQLLYITNVSKDLLKLLIAMYGANGYVHLIHKHTGKHWKMDVFAILSDIFYI